MSVYHRSTAKSRILQEYRNREEEIAAALSRQMTNNKVGLESDKRIRREIANSNERRRMQSINAGFQLLRSMIPHNEGEKLSKAAILQQTTEYITHLQQEKVKITAQNTYYKRILNEVSRRCNLDLDVDFSLYGGSPPTKRKKRDTESSDEGITADLEDFKYDEVKRELVELRQQLDRERQLRGILESRARTLEISHYAEQTRCSVGRTDESQAKVTQEKLYVEETRREDLVPSTPLHIDLETDRRVPASPPHKSESSDSNSGSGYVSRKNLETIVEAIRHLEGDEINTEQRFSGSFHTDSIRHHHHHHLHHHPLPIIPQGDESEKDSSFMSDQEERRSECSGRDSPSISGHFIKLQSAQNLQHASATSLLPQAQLTSTKVVTSSSYIDKYPTVTNVLHGKSPQPQFLYRPGVIVQKS